VWTNDQSARVRTTPISLPFHFQFHSVFALRLRSRGHVACTVLRKDALCFSTRRSRCRGVGCALVEVFRSYFSTLSLSQCSYLEKFSYLYVVPSLYLFSQLGWFRVALIAVELAVRVEIFIWHYFKVYGKNFTIKAKFSLSAFLHQKTQQTFL
jgi:hypothetical protein